MTTRILPAEEWHRLVGTELEPALAHMTPESATVFVVEDGADIVGCWCLVTVAHVEGLWVAPAHRKRGRVLVRLWHQLREITMQRGFRSVLTSAVSDDVIRLLESRNAIALPPAYVLPVEALRSENRCLSLR